MKMDRVPDSVLFHRNSKMCNGSCRARHPDRSEAAEAGSDFVSPMEKNVEKTGHCGLPGGLYAREAASICAALEYRAASHTSSTGIFCRRKRCGPFFSMNFG